MHVSSGLFGKLVGALVFVGAAPDGLDAFDRYVAVSDVHVDQVDEGACDADTLTVQLVEPKPSGLLGRHSGGVRH